jgi:sugar phosphate permease
MARSKSPAPKRKPAAAAKAAVTSSAAAAADPPDPDARSRRLAFAITWWCYASFYFTRKPFSVVKSTLGKPEALGLAPATLGMIDSAFLTAYALSQFVLGPLGDRLGARPMLTAMLACSALSTAAFATCTHPALLAAAMALNGVSQSAGYPLCMKALVPWLSEGSNRATTLGWWCTCQQVGGVLSTALAAWALGTLGWRSAFLAPAALVSTTALLVAACLPIKDTGGKATTTTGGGPAAPKSVAAAAPKQQQQEKPPPQEKVTLLAVARIPYLLHLGGAYFAIKLVRYTLIMWLPYYMAEVLGYAPTVRRLARD